jgi:hypothetical protein
MKSSKLGMRLRFPSPALTESPQLRGVVDKVAIRVTPSGDPMLASRGGSSRRTGLDALQHARMRASGPLFGPTHSKINKLPYVACTQADASSCI